MREKAKEKEKVRELKGDREREMCFGERGKAREGEREREMEREQERE